MRAILEVPRHAFVRAEAEQCGLLIDARVYYRALYRALEQAEHFAVISGWQFETGVPLLRGTDAAQATRPVKFLAFLAAMCEERPKLEIFLLAWDFSLVYAKDREANQQEKFNAAHPRIHFVWDTHPSLGGSHHQKFAVIDNAVGFVGGIDICDARWDDCDHRADNTDRVNVVGDPCKPYHDVQACFTGPVVRPLLDVFSERWRLAAGAPLVLPLPAEPEYTHYDVMQLSGGSAEHICAKHAALSRTRADSRAEQAPISEVWELFAAALNAAERLIYIETQYFTSRSIARVLLARMRDAARSKLDIVVILPHGADTAMEKLALEDTQEGVLSELHDAAAETGHGFRLLYPASRNADGSETATFIHSKILIVDDQLLMVGSPNCTERSLALDTELAITWECGSEQDHLTRCIRNVRARLLAEHSGRAASEFDSASGLCSKLDSLLEEGNSRLRRREIAGGGVLGPLLASVFDPGDDSITESALNG